MDIHQSMAIERVVRTLDPSRQAILSDSGPMYISSSSYCGLKSMAPG